MTSAEGLFRVSGCRDFRSLRVLGLTRCLEPLQRQDQDSRDGFRRDLAVPQDVDVFETEIGRWFARGRFFAVLLLAGQVLVGRDSREKELEEDDDRALQVRQSQALLGVFRLARASQANAHQPMKSDARRAAPPAPGAEHQLSALQAPSSACRRIPPECRA